MSWIREHTTIWRIALLALLLLALAGGWAFDQINVPAEYPCQPPNVRLEGDFCGLPIPGYMILLWMLVEIASQTVTQFTPVLFLYLLLGILLVLPFFTTLLFMIRKNHPRQYVVQVVVWGLALGVGVLWAISSMPRLYWQLWGIWLYLLTAVAGLILEALALAARRTR